MCACNHHPSFFYSFLVYQSTLACVDLVAFLLTGTREIGFLYQRTYNYSVLCYIFTETVQLCVISCLSQGTIDIKSTLTSGDIHSHHIAAAIHLDVRGFFSVRCELGRFHFKSIISRTSSVIILPLSTFRINNASCARAVVYSTSLAVGFVSCSVGFPELFVMQFYSREANALKTIVCLQGG